MTATERLRQLLDERGVEWWPMHDVENGYQEDRDTEFLVDGCKHVAHEWGRGLQVDMLTPEQVVAATLGRGTCQVDVLNTGDCAGYECSEYIMHCNACGHEFGNVLYNEDGDVWMSEPPNYCPTAEGRWSNDH